MDLLHVIITFSGIVVCFTSLISSFNVKGYTKPLHEGDKLALQCLPAEYTTGLAFMWTFLASATANPMAISLNQNYTKDNVTTEDGGQYTCYVVGKDHGIMSEIEKGKATISVTVLKAERTATSATSIAFTETATTSKAEEETDTHIVTEAASVDEHIEAVNSSNVTEASETGNVANASNAGNVTEVINLLPTDHAGNGTQETNNGTSVADLDAADAGTESAETGMYSFQNSKMPQSVVIGAAIGGVFVVAFAVAVAYFAVNVVRRKRHAFNRYLQF